MFQTKILSIKNLVKMKYVPCYQIGPAGVAAAKHVDPVNRPDQEHVIRPVMTSTIPVSDKHKAAMFAIVVRFEHQGASPILIALLFDVTLSNFCFSEFRTVYYTDCNSAVQQHFKVNSQTHKHCESLCKQWSDCKGYVWSSKNSESWCHLKKSMSSCFSVPAGQCGGNLKRTCHAAHRLIF